MKKIRWEKLKKNATVPERKFRRCEEPNPDTETSIFRSGKTLHTFRSVDRDKTDRQKNKELRDWRRKLGGLLAITLLICFVGVSLVSQFSGSFVNVTSNVPSLKSESAAKYKKIVNDYLAQNPFERFSFARRSENLDNYVKEKTPEVESVQVNQSGLLVSSLKITLRKPVAMWVSGGDTKYVDRKGTVFDVNYFEQPGVSIDDNSGVSVGDGTVTSSRFLSFVGQTTAYIASQGGGEVERVVVPSGAIRYVEFYLSGRTYPFKAQIDRMASSQASDIVSMVKYLDANKIKPSYVDARVAGKAYWK